jgi:hypothetical protein
LTWRAWLSTAFSLRYTINIGGVAFNASVLSDVEYAQSVSGMGIKGVATGSLTFRLYSAVGRQFGKGDEVYFSGVPGVRFKVDSYTTNGNVYTVTCYDCGKGLDKDFDMTDYTQYDASGSPKWYGITDKVLGTIETSTGTQVYFAPTRELRLCYNDLNGKTCRGILDDLSSVNCGFFRCVSGYELNFKAFSAPHDDGYGLLLSNVSEMNIQDQAAIDGIYALDGIGGKVYATGTANARIDVSGRYSTESNAVDIATQVFSGGSFTWRAWSIPSAAVSVILPLGSCVTVEGHTGYFPITSMRYKFGAEIIASLSGGTATLADEYKSRELRLVEKRVQKDTVYGDAVKMTEENGIVLVPNTAHGL